MAKDNAQETMPESNGAIGAPESITDRVLELGAAATQDFRPIKNVCAHLNAFHVFANDTSRYTEANHYCAHVNDEVRQCLLYDSPEPDARLVGVEYMVSSRIYNTLPPDERKLWHSHVFEVKSGMLIMPQPSRLVPDQAWTAAENAEMESCVLSPFPRYLRFKTQF